MKEGGILARLGRRRRGGGGEGERNARRLERRLGVRFHDLGLLEEALVHRSFAHERGRETTYERLEFLGDSVLGLVAAEWLYREYPELPEGRLSELKSGLVSRASLAAEARRLEVGAALRLGVGEERSGGREKDSLLADAMESILGALFLDRGLEAVRRVTEGLFERSLPDQDSPGLAQAKTLLQEREQAQGQSLPSYRLVAESGPDHEKRFTVECVLGDGSAAIAHGSSKKLAEQRAAAALIAERDAE